MTLVLGMTAVGFLTMAILILLLPPYRDTP